MDAKSAINTRIDAMKTSWILLPFYMLSAPCSAGEPVSFASDKSAVSCEQAMKFEAASEKLTVKTETGRDVPVEIFYPEQAGNYSLIAFSHGAFSAPDRYYRMLRPLAAAGFVIIAPTHIDSEAFRHDKSPSHPETWRTRNDDITLALSLPEEVREKLVFRNIVVDTGRVAAMGHSYGALIAQLSGGAVAVEPDGSSQNRLNEAVDSVVAWSPPGPMPQLMTAEGWSSMAVPSLAITGTADVLPGFIDDWEVHKASYDNAPPGDKWLWVGREVDHYFGGVFGREKPVDANSQLMFNRALATTVHFLQNRLEGNLPCVLQPPLDGEKLEQG